MPTPSNVQILTAIQNDLPVDLKSKVDAAITAGSTASLTGLSIQAQYSLLTFGLQYVIGKQIIFDVRGGWDDNISKLFLRDSPGAGLYTQIQAVDADPDTNVEDDEVEEGVDYTQDKVALPKIGSSFVTIDKEKVWAVSVRRQDLAKAFINEGGLADLIGLIIRSLEDKAAIFWYRRALANLASMRLEYAIPTGQYNEPEKCRAMYAYLENIAADMGIIGTKYNEAGFEGATNKSKLALLLYTSGWVSSQINVVASLFNSAKIELGSSFGAIEKFRDGESGGSNVVGYICDVDKYRIENYYREMLTYLNARRAFMDYYFHTWVKDGFNPYVNGVRLVKVPTAPEIVKNDDGTVSINSYTVNRTKVAYTTDGTDPTAASTPYTAPLSGMSGKTVKAMVVVDDGQGFAVDSPIASKAIA